MPRHFSIEEPFDLTAYQRSMQGMPERVEQAIAAGARHGPDVPLAQAARILEPGGDGLVDAVVRNSDGILVVACLTEMPGVTPEMWDWWFGWHSISAARYCLWHPEDHVWAGIKEDRMAEPEARKRYVGNVSYVDERLNTPAVQKLAIAFRPPEELGLNTEEVDAQGTAICARVHLRPAKLAMGHLIHLVRRTETGSEMISRFWLGDFESQLPLIGGAVSSLLNRPAIRRRPVSDAMGLNLLAHCAKEMNHLARMLPELYAEFGET